MKKLIKIELKQKIALITCMVLLFLLCRPMTQLMTYENATQYANTPEMLLNIMEEFFLPGIITDFLPTLIVSVITGIVFFSYLFSKKMVDLYHSIPVNRKRLFLSNYISGVIVYLIALVAENLIGMLIAIPNHYMTLTAIKNMFITIGVNIIHFLFGYGITIFTIMITGKIVVAVLGTLVISLYCPIFMILLSYFRNYFFVTSTDCTAVIADTVVKYSWLSPVTSYLDFIENTSYFSSYKLGRIRALYGGDMSSVVLKIVLTMVVVALFTVIAYALYQKRPSEAAGKAIAFTKSQPFIRIPIALLGGMIGSWFMMSSFNGFKTNWLWFGLLLGVILTHCILEVIFKESFKAFISDKIQLAVSVAITVCIISVFYIDITGYDKYIPEREKIESAAVYFNGVDSNLSCMTLTEDPANPGCYVTDFRGYMEQSFMNPSDAQIFIDKVYALSQVGVSVVDDMIENRYELSSGTAIPLYDEKYAVEESVYTDYDSVTGYKDEEIGDVSKEEAYQMASQWMEENGIVEAEKEQEERSITVDIYYVLKNGKQVLRHYDVPVSKIRTAMNEVYKSEEFNRTHFDIFNDNNMDAIYKTEVYDALENKVCLFTEEDNKKFLDAYVKDLKNINIDTISKLPVGRVSMMFKSPYGFDESFSGYYIYEEFTNTLSYLENLGCDVRAFDNSIKLEDIQSLSVGAYGMYKYEEGDYLYADEIVYTAEENEDILSKIVPKLRNSNNLWSNELLINSNSASGVDMCVYFAPDKGIQKIVSVIFDDGQVPEYIKEDIAIKIWSDNRY